MMKVLVDCSGSDDMTSAFKAIKTLGSEDGYLVGRPKSSAVKGTLLIFFQINPISHIRRNLNVLIKWSFISYSKDVRTFDQSGAI